MREHAADAWPIAFTARRQDILIAKIAQVWNL
jgi:hypothetical protein